MTDVSRLPPYVANLFTPRPPLPYVRPVDVPPEQRSNPKISGVSQYLDLLKAEKESTTYTPTESWFVKQQREKREKQSEHVKELKKAVRKWNPQKDPQVRGDPFKTIFVARLDYSVTESDLEREFNRYGPIEKIRVVRETETGKSRGYAFIVYERESDSKVARSESKGKVIKGRKILVDVERGRTVKRWLPRRLGGGLGGRHYTRDSLFRDLDEEYNGSRSERRSGRTDSYRDRGGYRSKQQGSQSGGGKDGGGGREWDRDSERERGGRGEREWDRDRDRDRERDRDGGRHDRGSRYRGDRDRSPRRSHY